MKNQPKAFTPQDARRTVADQLRPPFRGEIWEFFKDVPMGRGFANENEPFDIDTANYLREPLRVVRERQTIKCVIRAAVQMLKTFFLMISGGYLIANDPGDTIMFLSGDQTSFDEARARFNPYIRSVPQIGKQIDDVTASSSAGRYDITTEVLYLPNMIFRMWPLNLSSTQRNTIRYILISDAFLSQGGLLKEAIARTTQHYSRFLRDRKVIIESQGGKDKDDFDQEWLSTDQRMHHIVCPFCNTGQEFVWHRERGSDFTPVPTVDIPSLDHAAWIEHFRKELLEPGRKHAGMKRGDHAKSEDGTYDERAVLAETVYECFHCGTLIADTPANRLALDRSSYYVPTYLKAATDDVGFSWSAWAGQRLAWGMIMVEYLRAKQAATMGNDDELRQWYQKRAARSWSAKLVRRVHEITPGSYDPNQLMPDEYCRIMGVDCQQNEQIKDATGKSVTGYFWYIVRVVDKRGNSRQLDRGFCKSWEDLIRIQRVKWKVPNDRVCIDMAHWPEVTTKAALEAETVTISDNPALPEFMRKKQVSWICMLGAKEQRFMHQGKTEKRYSQPQFIPVPIYRDGDRPKIVTVKKVRWSNYGYKHQLDLLRSGVAGVPKFEVLAREHLDDLSKEMEKGNFTYEKQMESEYVEVVRGKDEYQTISGGQPHYRDCECMILTRMDMDSLIGLSAVGAAEGQSG